MIPPSPRRYGRVPSMWSRTGDLGPLARVALVAVLVCGLFAADVRAGAQSTTQRVPADIDDTGEEDVTEELNEFLASVPDGGVAELGEDARYRVDGSLLLEDRHDLTVDGNGAEVFAVTRGDRTRSQWILEGGSNLAFRNLVVRGANLLGGTEPEAYVADLEAQHGFQVEGTQGLELDRVRIENVYGDFVYLSRDDEREWSRNVWIHDSSFARNGRQAIAVVAGRDIVIERNQISETRRATFDLEPNTPNDWGAQNVHILDNDIGPGRLLFVASHGNGPVDDVVIARNRLHGRALTVDVNPPDDQRRSNWVVVDNESDSSASGPRLMRFFRVDGLQIRDNGQNVDRLRGAPIQLDDVCGEDIGDNNFGDVTPIAREGEPCPADLNVPEPPAIPAREAALATGEVSEPTPTTTTTSEEPEAEPATRDQVDPDALDSGTNWSAVLWWILGAAAVLAGLGGLVALVATRRSPGPTDNAVAHDDAREDT